MTCIVWLSLWMTSIEIGSGLAAVSDSGSWSRAASAPTARTEVTTATVSGKVYVVGGFSAPNLANILDLTITDKVEEYDPSTDRWQTRGALPAKLHHAAAVALGERLYVIGGFTKSLLSIWQPVNSLYVYEPKTDSWTEGPPMPTARGALAGTAIDGKIMAIGGYGESENSGAVELYDPVAQRWDILPSIPTPRDHLVAATVQGRIYVIGGRLGRDYHRNLSVVDMFNPVTRQWTKAADLPTGRSGMTAAVIDDVIYVVGGEAPGGTFSTNEAYQPATNTWTTAAPMPTGRHGLGSAVVGHDMFVVAGGPKPGGSFTDANEVFRPSRPQTPSSAHKDTEQRRASSSHVGAVMAILATFGDADVLPPEKSSQANIIIKALIQFQSAFLKSRHPAVREFFAEAQRAKFGTNARESFAAFEQTGWTSVTLEALADESGKVGDWDTNGLSEGFREFNVGRRDFDLIIDLFQQAKIKLHARGENVHRVYAARRRDMPGATF